MDNRSEREKDRDLKEALDWELGIRRPPEPLKQPVNLMGLGNIPDPDGMAPNKAQLRFIKGWLERWRHTMPVSAAKVLDAALLGEDGSAEAASPQNGEPLGDPAPCNECGDTGYMAVDRFRRPCSRGCKPPAPVTPLAPSTEVRGLDAAGMMACPFCAQRGATITLPNARAGCWNAKCWAYVGDSAHFYATEEAAVQAWNTRPTPLPSVEARERVKAIIHTYWHKTADLVVDEIFAALASTPPPPDAVRETARMIRIKIEKEKAMMDRCSAAIEAHGADARIILRQPIEAYPAMVYEAEFSEYSGLAARVAVEAAYRHKDFVEELLAITSQPLPASPAIQAGELDLEAIEARCEAATPGPWWALVYESLEKAKLDSAFPWADKHAFPKEVACVWKGSERGYLGLPGIIEVNANDGTFIAHARQDIPALIAEVRRLRSSTQAHTSETLRGSQPLPTDRAPKCFWEEDDPDWDSWKTGCGQEFVLTEGNPEDNEMKYCCFCAKEITIRPPNPSGSAPGEAARPDPKGRNNV